MPPEPSETSPPVHRIDKPEQIRSISESPAQATPTGARADTSSPVAIFVAHGMGQQAPFETMDAIATGLIGAAGGTAGEVRASTVRIGERKTQRLEFTVDAGGKPVEVHVYEGYWAPLTEGEVGIGDVMRFLVGAGRNGLRLSWTTGFIRWLFGRSVNFGGQTRTSCQLLLALAVVLSLVAMNGLIAAVVSARTLDSTAVVSDKALEDSQAADTVPAPASDRRSAPVRKAWPSDTLLADLNLIMLAFVAISVLFGVVLFLLPRLRPGKPHANKPWRIVNGITQVLFRIWVAATILAGIGFGLVLSLDWLGRRPLAGFPWHPEGTGWLWLWGILLLISWKVRSLLVEFMGDVAAYVSSHTLDRFHKLRKEIKAAVYETAHAIYAASDGNGGYLYPRIFLLGHSLGSVVIYDTLNALLNEDDLDGGRLAVAGRTELLLTFGSPLDKVAFVFARHNATDHQRALAATVQPLIQDYERFRRLRWINIWSRRDIISGSLDFFDDPDVQGDMRVQNEEDPDALIPLVAHTEYWKNPLLFRRVTEMLKR